MKTESTTGKLQSEVTETKDYHRQSSVGNFSESLQEREVDTTRVRQSKKDHVYAVSDDQGNLLEHYRYNAFGELEVYSPQTQNKLAGTAIANPVLWNSRRYDEQTDLYYYKYRHYKADIGRWLGRDPIEEDGGINLYGFVGDQSVNFWDAYGAIKATPKWKNNPNTNGSCVNFHLEWKLEQQQAKNSRGWIISRISFSGEYTSYDTGLTDDITNKIAGLTNDTFYEAFGEFTPTSTSHTDGWKSDLDLENTHGSLEITALMFFYDSSRTGALTQTNNHTLGFQTTVGTNGWTLPVGANNQGRPPSGGTPSRWDQPLYYGNPASFGEKTQKLTMKIDWDCCDKQNNYPFAPGYDPALAVPEVREVTATYSH